MGDYLIVALDHIITSIGMWIVADKLSTTL